MSEPHEIREPSELDLYRENQRLAMKLAEAVSERRSLEVRERDTMARLAAAEERAEKADTLWREQLRLRLAAEADRDAERKAHEETKKANREAERIFLDELLARRATEADRDRLREALREIAQHPCWLTKMGYTMRCESAQAVGPCSPCHARRALDASGAGEEGE